jgi:probable rRNA maturation factor
VLGKLGRSNSELSIAIVLDDEIAALNSEHRGKRSATDVLSFSLLEGEHSDRRGKLLGDVVIGIETAARQARAAHRGLDAEVARLLIHGILHLLGWNHEEPAEAKLMRAEELRLWHAIRT